MMSNGGNFPVKNLKRCVDFRWLLRNVFIQYGTRPLNNAMV